ncbi:MAG: DUF4442 domain-containing protein [Desulfosarcinaceae bacterium]|nr:DUF4442 domain-containing protein [Desulfosarcinaceae bacterium]
MKPWLFKWLIHLYPPYLGTGIRITRLAGDYSHLRVEMPLRFYNRNYVGTHFGGSLYAMVDPFYMLMLIQLLGRDYVVWDRSARIDFVAPGRGRVAADFHLPPETVAEIRARTADGEKYLPTFTVDVRDGEGGLVARAAKELYIRRRRPPH